MEAEVIGFHRPSSEGRTLYVTGIPRYLHRDEKWVKYGAENRKIEIS